VARVILRFLAVFFFLHGLGVASFAQESHPLAPADPPVAAPAKAPAKKIVRKSAGQAQRSAKPTQEEADRAARLEEGRKKFFERSMGFDNGGGADAPITFGGGNGFSPSAGFKF
jgi:hypothetical protein